MTKVESMEQEVRDILYPGHNILLPIPRFSLYEITLGDRYTEFMPKDINLSTEIGNCKFNLPLMSANMDTVSGHDLAKVMFEIGAGALIYRFDNLDENSDDQMNALKQTLDHKPCLVKNLISLKESDTVKKAHAIRHKHKFSTIPVLKNGTLLGIFFTKKAPLEVADEIVTKWMTPVDQLITVSLRTSLKTVKNRLLNERNCTTLPVVGKNNKFYGMYFRKDCRPAQPTYYQHNLRHAKNGSKTIPQVGIAVSPIEQDLKRIKQGIELGASFFVIDSSHANSKNTVDFVSKTMKIMDRLCFPDYLPAIIAGNVASANGYLRMAALGVDAVKVGIGSGSICTTTNKTAIGVPLWSAIRECFIAKLMLEKLGLHAPKIIADGGLNNTDQMVVALAAGADMGMCGQYFAACSESIAAKKHDLGKGDPIQYRGMASDDAINDRVSIRYGEDKKSEEGVSGYVIGRGHLKTWIDYDKEYLQSGFSHLGVNCINDLHNIGTQEPIFSLITSSGQLQNEPRVIQAIPQFLQAA